jgi:hypothetical protein
MAAALPYVMMAGSAAMSIAGGVSQANAQRQAGDAAYQQAVAKNNAAVLQAQQMEQQAGEEQAAAGRQAIDAQRKGQLMAARLRAVMGASGGGIDNNLLASLQGEGNYNADVAQWQGDERARADRNQAALARWGGANSLQQGVYSQSAMDTAADSTMLSTIGKTALSFASKYGGSGPSGIDSEIASWSKYGQDDLSRASLDATMQRYGSYVA